MDLFYLLFFICGQIGQLFPSCSTILLVLVIRNMFIKARPPPCRLNRLVCSCFVQVDGSNIMELQWPRTNRSGRLRRHEFTAYIKRCVKCDRAEFGWWPIHEPFDDETLPYTCSRCIGKRNTIEKTRWFVLMYNARIPSEVF